MAHQDTYNPYTEYDPYSFQQRQYSNPTPPQRQPSDSSRRQNSFGQSNPADLRTASPFNPTQSPPQPQRQATMRSFLTGDSETTRPNFASDAPPLPQQHKKQQSVGFDTNDYQNKEAAASSFSQYRAAHQENLWTKGGSGRCVGRFCCCSLMTIVWLLVSIIGTLVLFIRPPAISVDNVAPATNTQTIQATSDGITVNLGVNIFVSNPNYFSVNFKYVKAEIFYPLNGNSTLIGGGETDNLVFESHSSRNFTFPFAINYKTADDPRSAILLDLANKCGVFGTPSDIKVDYKIILGIRFAFITISPSISNSFSFACPIDPSVIKGIMNGQGLGSLGSIALRDGSLEEL